MIFGYLAHMVATMPSWVAMAITRDELDLAPQGGPTMTREKMNTSAEYFEALNKAAADGARRLERTSDEHLKTPWRLLVSGQVVMETPRHVMMQRHASTTGRIIAGK